MTTQSAPNRFIQKGKFKTVEGSFIQPEYAGLRLVLNFISMSGKPDGEIYNTFDKKWKKIREEVKGWFASRINWKLGEINTVAVQTDTWVINCLCKDTDDSVNEAAMNACVKKLVSMAKLEKASIHVPKQFLDEVPGLQTLLETSFINEGINVSVYLSH